ncbi:MAG: accessory Sec system protein Asp1 [Roseburia sp.]|nr:accessory Sec system protein Asp1 [Roseburia sp.]MCM1099133.1 accessory Sec system protein Asp1 [Ruminococcus flavefaciens]
MLYFIPAWYQEKKWSESEQIWYIRRTHTEFDDTVKQIQLFHRSGVYPYQILLLSFAPNFRHFLHRQGVYHAPYWSCFDAIQCVKRKRARVLSFHDLAWPAGIEFVYSPFVIVAMLRGKKYAQIEFGEDGNPIRIDIYQNGVINRRNLYDDRGFVSSSVVYKEGQPVYQDYYMESGVWKLRCFEEDGRVEINPKCPEYLLQYRDREYEKTFAGQTYSGMDRVIQEVFDAYLQLTAREDIFCVAMQERHVPLLRGPLERKKRILSFYADRYSVRNHPESIDVVESADYIIVDSRENMERLQKESAGLVRKMTDITPFDSRVDFGISQQLHVQKIMVPVDGLREEVFRELIRNLGEYLEENEKARVHLFTRRSEWDRGRRLLEQTAAILSEAGLEPGWAIEGTPKGTAENNLDQEEEIPLKFFVEQCVDELAVSRCMREQRVMVDLQDKSEVYIQIMAISMGIPQIVSRNTEFVEHGKNGFVVRKIEDVKDILAYYLDSLTSWNEAAVYSYELGKQYTTGRLLEKWEEVIRFIGRDSGTTVRK